MARREGEPTETVSGFVEQTRPREGWRERRGEEGGKVAGDATIGKPCLRCRSEREERGIGLGVSEILG
ncbi:hypothetical protein U1Q18_036266 [Sarracenia purpurea var. burkii]